MKIIADINGLNEVIKNLDKVAKAGITGAYAGMDYILREVANYIKTDYVFSATGRGFDDQTGNLRNSIHPEVGIEKKEIIGFIVADMDYAIHVETANEGTHAFLLPGVRDKQKDILEAVKTYIDDAIGGI